MRRYVLWISGWLLLIGGQVAAQETTVTGGTEAELRALVARLIGGEAAVSIGALPAELPYPLPLPPEVVVLATITRPAFYMDGATEGKGHEILLHNAPLPKALVEFYQTALADWNVQQVMVNEPAGFQTFADAFLLLCAPDNAMSLNLAAATQDGVQVQATLSLLVPADVNMCAPTGEIASPAQPNVIPSLRLPADVTLLSNVVGNLLYAPPQGFALSYPALLRTERPLTEVFAEYNQQLSAAGWNHVSSGATSTMAFSRWTVRDSSGQVWQGGLLFAEDVVPQQFNVVIYAQLME